MLQANHFFLIAVSDRQDNGQTCVARSCNRLVTGRRLKYGRALAIIRTEEYLDAVSNHYIHIDFLFSIKYLSCNEIVTMIVPSYILD